MIKIRRCDGTFILELADELVAELGWSHGDGLSAVVEGSDLRVIRIQTAHERAMDIARKAMTEHSETLATLAKS